jgi:hypothetical protein
MKEFPICYICLRTRVWHAVSTNEQENQVTLYQLERDNRLLVPRKDIMFKHLFRCKQYATLIGSTQELMPKNQVTTINLKETVGCVSQEEIIQHNKQ